MAEDKAEVEDNNLDEDDGDDKSDHGRSLLALTIAPQLLAQSRAFVSVRR